MTVLTADPPGSGSAEGGSSDVEGKGNLSTDDLFHLLQNERRRKVLSYLTAHDEGEGVDMRRVAEEIAAAENDTTTQALRSKERQRVYIALYQSHLPKLDEAGVIEYDQRKGWIESTPLTAEVGQYIAVDTEQAAEPEETATGRTNTVTLSAMGLSVLLLIVGIAGIEPFTGWTLAFVIFGLLVATAAWNARHGL